MTQSATILFGIATVLYFATMFFVIRMVREVGDRRPWLMLLAALFVLAVYRLLAFQLTIDERQEVGPWFTVLASFLLLISLFYFRKITVAERESKVLAQQRTAERDESESRYRALAELCPDVMYVEIGGRISYVNAAAVRFFGAHVPSDLLGRAPADMVAPESRKNFVARIQRLQDVGQNMPVALEEWLRLDGSTVPVEATAAVVPWRGARGVLVILRDVSERKRAEEEKSHLLASERAARSAAEHASRMKDEFLATLSHELRTPLTAILGWSQILLTGRTSESERTQGLETIERNARAQTKLVEDLLDMSSVISGKLRLEMQRLAPRSFIEAAVETIKPTAEAKGVHLKQRVDPHAGPLCGDANRLQQVVWNLLSNAVKFTPAGGTVELTLEPIDSQLELTVADTGQGISPDFLPYVFDRFRQADATITRRYKGLGLGLAIVKQLVELHGGTVRVHSDGEDRGATFVVSLPLAISQDRGDGNLPQDADSRSDGEHNGKLIDLSGLKIVVVDDEPDACLLIKQVLDRCHAVVLTASSAAEAIPLVEMSHPDMLISDIGMPQVDGYELLRRIRALQPDHGGQVPAIALTAFARPEDRTRSLAAGYSMHVSKPIEPEKLTATVAHLAGRTNHCGAARAD